MLTGLSGKNVTLLPGLFRERMQVNKIILWNWTPNVCCKISIWRQGLSCLGNR